MSWIVVSRCKLPVTRVIDSLSSVTYRGHQKPFTAACGTQGVDDFFFQMPLTGGLMHHEAYAGVHWLVGYEKGTNNRPGAVSTYDKVIVLLGVRRQK